MKLIQRTALLFCIAAVGCSNEDDPPADNDAQLQAAALLGVKTYVNGELTSLNTAAAAIQTAAPAADADGWNNTSDTAAVTAMKAQWKNARVAYERVEGAIAVLFPNLDASTDERYDGFIAEGPDMNLFDGEHVTGVHAIERILWADTMPPDVLEFESMLDNYTVAAFPASQAEAEDFKTKLTARLVTDTATMKNDFAPLALDTASAYRGVIGSIAEQVEKVALATTGESESRYALHTLADMRANLEGGRKIYEPFRAWIQSKDGGAELDTKILAAFDKVEAEYDRLPGDSIPAVPMGWNPDSPTAEHLATDYGKLWALLDHESDPDAAGSLVSLMNEGAAKLNIPTLPE